MSEFRKINVSSPELDKEETIKNISQVLESGQLAQGPFVLLSEKKLTEEIGSEFAAATVNGTASLKAALLAGISAVRGIKPEYIDREMSSGEIIVPAFSFNATLNAPLQLGSKIKIVDILPDTFALNPELVQENISEKTLAVMPVDLYGQAADTRHYENLLRDKKIALIRDAAQAHGSTIDEQSIVAHSDAISLSFYATKNISSGEGGAVLTNNSEIDRIVRMYRNQGMSVKYKYDMIGDNLRLSDLHAAILVSQIGKLALFTKKRQNNAKLLTERLSEIDGIITPKIAEGMNHVFHQYTILVEDEYGMSRDDLSEALQEKGIGTGIYYPKTMTDHETYRNHPRIDNMLPTPVADRVSERVLSLPVHTKLTLDDVDYISKTVKSLRK